MLKFMGRMRYDKGRLDVSKMWGGGKLVWKKGKNRGLY